MRKYLLLIILFILGIPLIPVGILLLLLVVPFDPKGVQRGRYTSLWAWPLVYFNIGCTLKVEGRENIDTQKNYVIVANHTAMMDIPMVQLAIGNIRWVSKKSLILFPMVGWVLIVQNAILLKRGDAKSAKDMIEKGVRLLRNGRNVAIFPEGTRTKDGKIGEFKPGAFLMAKQANVEVLPIFLYNAKQTEGSKTRVKLVAKILPSIPLGDQRLSAFSTQLQQKYTQEFENTPYAIKNF